MIKISKIDHEDELRTFDPDVIKMDFNNLKLDFLNKNFDPNNEIMKLAIFLPELKEQVKIRMNMTMNGSMHMEPNKFINFFPNNILLNFTQFILFEVLGKKFSLDNEYYYKDLFRMAELLL